MPRKKHQESHTVAAIQDAPSAAAVAEAEMPVAESTPSQPATEAASESVTQADGLYPRNPDAKNWGPPYKAFFTSTANGFEMGENRRYRQRVFKFIEKPPEEMLAKLKEAGFTYRAGEKAWTIQADAETRKLSDDLAREFAGEAQGISR